MSSLLNECLLEGHEKMVKQSNLVAATAVFYKRGRSKTKLDFLCKSDAMRTDYTKEL